MEKSYRLESLINEFFDITRFALQKQTLNKEPVNLSVMLQQLTDEFHPLFEERQVQCRLQLKEGVMIEADADKLARVFDNLLRNALAYCDRNSDIEITMQENAGGVELMFANIGPQLSDDQISLLFREVLPRGSFAQRRYRRRGIWDWRSPGISWRCTAARSTLSVRASGLNSICTFALCLKTQSGKYRWIKLEKEKRRLCLRLLFLILSKNR